MVATRSGDIGPGSLSAAQTVSGTVTQSGAVGGAGSAEFGNVAERIGAVVAEVGRIRSAADTEGIQHE